MKGNEMENINVREVTPERKVETEPVYTYLTHRERNLNRNDAFVNTQIYSADAAMDRLKLLRNTMNTWKTSFNNLDRRQMPADLVETYEQVWALMRNIELGEVDIITIGD